MTSFDINHDSYLDVNEQLLRGVHQVREIIAQLNEQLRAIPEAVWGGPQPIWLENQQTWNKDYAEMESKINRTAVSSVKVHEIFKEGDYNGTRIMLQ